MIRSLPRRPPIVFNMVTCLWVGAVPSQKGVSMEKEVRYRDPVAEKLARACRNELRARMWGYTRAKWDKTMEPFLPEKWRRIRVLKNFISELDREAR